MTCGIYKIVNKVNGKMYIGQSVDIEHRWIAHKSTSKTSSGHLYKAMRIYGIDNFTFSIICEVPECSLSQYEISYIKYYDTTNSTKGYNKTFGGEGGRPTNETKQKMSETKKNNMTDETKNKMSCAKSGENHPFFGKTLSNEHKQKISESGKKQYIYQGNVYNGIQELANFLGIHYKTLTARISRKQIEVTIIRGAK